MFLLAQGFSVSIKAEDITAIPNIGLNASPFVARRQGMALCMGSLCAGFIIHVSVSGAHPHMN